MSILNIAQAIKLKIKERLDVLPLAVKELSKSRLEICNGCPSLDNSLILDTEVCKECGCYLQLKTLVKEESCKIGKWKEPVEYHAYLCLGEIIYYRGEIKDIATNWRTKKVPGKRPQLEYLGTALELPDGRFVNNFSVESK